VRRKLWLLALVSLALLTTGAGAVWAQAQDYHFPGLPDITVEPLKNVPVSPFLQYSFFVMSLGLIPYLLVTATAYIRVSITFSYLKAALGSPQALGQQLSQGIILMVTFYVMYPVALRTHDIAVAPYLSGKIEQADFGKNLTLPLREWMLAQTRDKDLKTFDRLGGFHTKTRTDVPFIVLYPSFIVSEVKTGFMIGFMIYIPFLVVDMVVSATMMSMGMFMLSPMQIAQPFKLLMFCSIDGWHIYILGVLHSFNRPSWY